MGTEWALSGHCCVCGRATKRTSFGLGERCLSYTCFQDSYVFILALRPKNVPVHMPICKCSYWFERSGAGHGIFPHGRRGRGAHPSHNAIFTVEMSTLGQCFPYKLCVRCQLWVNVFHTNFASGCPSLGPPSSLTTATTTHHNKQSTHIGMRPRSIP